MIKLFSTDCPRCRVLETKLNQAGINFEKEKNVDEIIQAGFSSAPVLKVNEEYYDFATAVKWVNNYEN